MPFAGKAINLFLRETSKTIDFSDPLPFFFFPSCLNLESLLVSMTNNVFPLTGEER